MGLFLGTENQNNRGSCGPGIICVFSQTKRGTFGKHQEAVTAAVQLAGDSENPSMGGMESWSRKIYQDPKSMLYEGF